MLPQLTRRTFLKTSAAVSAAGILRGVPPYDPSWDSLAPHADPTWFNDAKFGIYFHWGIYSVPAFDTEWYSRNMYIEGQRANTFHKLVYGPPAKFGYKDFIPMFQAEKFNPEEWAELFRKAGAKYAGPVSEHADGFSMWDSKVNPWNAGRMGPRRDVVGEMARALRSEGLKLLATFHHQWLWGWYPTEDKTLDCSQPQYSDLYGPPAPESPFDYDKPLPPPPQQFQDNWEAKIKEVIDRYQPDLIYFDSRLNIIDEPHLSDCLAYYYSQADRWQNEVGVTYKQQDLPAGVGILDLEQGRMNKISAKMWQTDQTIDWNSWCYVQKPDLKSADRLVDGLVDIVSKNGTLLLDVNPTAQGVMPEPTVERLLAIGKWLGVNGEAIYGTRPWKIFGEGPTQVVQGEFGEDKIPEFAADDIRFTSRWKTLYAIALDWPKATRQLLVKSLNTQDALLGKGEIAEVSLLGSDAKLHWQHDSTGLTIQLPPQKPGDFAYVFKLLLN